MAWMRRLPFTALLWIALVLLGAVAAVAAYPRLTSLWQPVTSSTPAGKARVIVPAGALPPGTSLTIAETAPAELPPEVQRLGPTVRINAPPGLELAAPVTITLPYNTKLERPTGMVPLVLLQQGELWRAVEPGEELGKGVLQVPLLPRGMSGFADGLASPESASIAGINLTPILARLTEHESDHFVVRYFIGEALLEWAVEKRLEGIYQHYKGLGFRAPDIEKDPNRRGPDGEKYIVRVNLWSLSPSFVWKVFSLGSYFPCTRQLELNIVPSFLWNRSGTNQGFEATLPHEYFHAVQLAYPLLADSVRPQVCGTSGGGGPSDWLWLIEPTAATAGASFQSGSPQRDPDYPVLPLDERLARLPDSSGIDTDQYRSQDFFAYIARAAGVKNNGYLKPLLECAPDSQPRASAAPQPFAMECMDNMVRSMGFKGMPDAYAGFVRSGYLRMRGERQAVNAYSRQGTDESKVDQEVSRLLTPKTQAAGDFSFDLEQWQSRLLRVETKEVPGSGALRLSLQDGKDRPGLEGWAWALGDGDKVDMSSEVSIREGVIELWGWGQGVKTVEILLPNASSEPRRVGGTLSVVSGTLVPSTGLEVYHIATWWQPAPDGQFNYPSDVAVDGTGDVYVTDWINKRVQKFSGDGRFLAKWGSPGNGDGQFDWPGGIAVDGAGNVYVSDESNARVQKFSSDGRFLAKWGTPGNGDGQFNYPRGIAVDAAGNVYVTDYENARVQKFSSDGRFLAKWGSRGKGDGEFYEPWDIALDLAGNVYVTDTGNNRVQKFSSNGRFLAKWGTLGSADGQMGRPAGIAVSRAGEVYVADYFNYRVQKFSSDGRFLAKWGSRGSGDGQLESLWGVTLDSAGNVYVADSGNHRVQKFSSGGRFLSTLGSRGGGDGQLSSPWGVALDSVGNVYVTDVGNRQVQKFSPDGRFLSRWGTQGSGAGQFNSPNGIAVDAAGNVYVADENNARVQKFSSDGRFLAQWGSRGSGDGQFDRPLGVAVDVAGNVYVADSSNDRVQKFSSDGRFLTKWGSQGSGDGQFRMPDGIAVDGAGSVYVLDPIDHRVQKFSSDGRFLAKWGSIGKGDGQFGWPKGIAVDGAGIIYVSDVEAHMIHKFSPDGRFLGKWGPRSSGAGEPFSPRGIAIDASGRVYVADEDNDQLHKFAVR
ncbi:MAG: hypothetical protein HYX94_06080 [Chloroflexi bacterium]|nr:hypothetical protein [Chloroflexota bacterium]